MTCTQLNGVTWSGAVSSCDHRRAAHAATLTIDVDKTFTLLEMYTLLR